MTNTPTTGLPPPGTEGHTVRDIVEYSPGVVNEVWCRKILRQTLQALEACHARQAPHPAITPDSIALKANGDAALVADAAPAVSHAVPDDLRALAKVIHYAITQELAPNGPLRGRALPGYSPSLVNAIDKCLASDPAERPQTIDQLRELLGVVAPGALTRQAAAPAPAAAPPEAAPSATPAARPAPPGRRAVAPGAASSLRIPRWLMIGVAASVLLLAATALYSQLRGTDSGDTLAVGTSAASEQPAAAPAPTQAQVAAPAAGPGAESVPAAAGVDAAPAVAAAVPPMVTLPATEAPPPNTLAATNYKLLIKPWGTVFVDGVERGVSPPLKQLPLPAGAHTVRIVNPGFPDHVLRVESGKSQSGRIAHTFTAASR